MLDVLQKINTEKINAKVSTDTATKKFLKKVLMKHCIFLPKNLLPYRK